MHICGEKHLLLRIADGAFHGTSYRYLLLVAMEGCETGTQRARAGAEICLMEEVKLMAPSVSTWAGKEIVLVVPRKRLLISGSSQALQSLRPAGKTYDRKIRLRTTEGSGIGQRFESPAIAIC